MADSYRVLAPSTQSTDRSSSSGKASAANDTPITSSGGNSGAGGSNSGDGVQRRRRHPSHVTVMACNECRKARAKCDGQRPAFCSRCNSRNLRCLYEPHTKTHKDDLLREIEYMRQEHAGLQDEHFELKETTKDLEQQQHNQSVILDILTHNGHVEEVIRRLREGESQESIAQWLQGRPELRQFIASISESDRHLIAVVSRVESLFEVFEPSSNPIGLRRWTRVSQSDALIRHLFELYFTWAHPIHMLFSEVDFLQSYRHGDERYCSSALVNAICGLACHLLDSPVPGVTSRDVQDRMNLRNGFMDEARNLLSPGPGLPMTSLQAFAVMFIADLSAGKARSAAGYLRCAADHLVPPSELGHSSEDNVQLSQWGIHTLNTAWSGITYQKPFNPVSPRTEVFINVALDQDSAPEQWRYYRQPGDDTNIPKRQSFAILTACQQAKLYRIVHDTINVYCGARGRVTAAAVIGCFKRFHDWNANLPEEIARTDEESQPLPHVLALHIQYNVAIIQLLAPLAASGYFHEEDDRHIRNTLTNHARTGLNLVAHGNRLYSSRYGMPITAFCILHLGDALMKYSSDESLAQNVLTFCLDILQQNRAGFPLCGPLLQMFLQNAKQRGIEPDQDVDARAGSHDRYGVDQILDACTRLEYSQPVDQIKRYIDRNIGEDWTEEWNKQMDQPRPRRQSTTDRSMQITSLLNKE
ncbi:hypothetical protein MMC11_000756 [Xylographa trunciseda]|nr:hypothetical protein [Xylographa trunciseda]